MDLIPRDLRDAWAPTVGNFFIEFGHLEILVSEIVRMSCLPGQFEALCELQFQKRAVLACAALIHRNPADEQRIKTDFKTVNDIATRRNIAVHNGLSLTEVQKDGQYFYEVGMTRNYKASEVWLQRADLEHDTALLQEIQERLYVWARQIPTRESANDLR